MPSNPMICFTCGQETSAGPRMNHLPDGRPCPACRERLLESLDPALPGFTDQRETVESLADIADEIDLDADPGYTDPPQPA